MIKQLLIALLFLVIFVGEGVSQELRCNVTVFSTRYSGGKSKPVQNHAV